MRASQGKPHDARLATEGEDGLPVDQGIVNRDGLDMTSAAKDLQKKDKKDAASSKPVVGRLTDERIRRLDEIGFVWSLVSKFRRQFVFVVGNSMLYSLSFYSLVAAR